MSLRDWFAGQALVGIISENANPASSGSEGMAKERYAERAFAYADAMLAERNK